MNCATCPRCAGRNASCPLCKGTGIFDASDPATIPMLNGMGNLGIDWGAIGSGLASMGASAVRSLGVAFPQIAASTLTTLVSAKIAEKVNPAPKAESAPKEKAPAKAKAAPKPAPAKIVAPVSTTPSWLMPAGLVAGGVAVATVAFLAFKKKGK